MEKTAELPGGMTASWYLVGRVDTDTTVRKIDICSSPFRVGRRSDCSLTLMKRTVSADHAELFVCGESLWIRDLQSTNGTFVNGKRLTDRRWLKHGDIIQFADLPFRVQQEAVTCTYQPKSDLADTSHEILSNTGDQAYALCQFDKLMSDGAVVPHFQPIVALPERRTIGYEVLGRSRLFGLQTPKAMFQAAAQLGLEAELSRMFRLKGVMKAAKLPGRPMLFVNTHPSEIGNDDLRDSLCRLRKMKPNQPLVLEVPETAVVDGQAMLTLRSELRQLDIELAYDDFGVGQSRLMELSSIRPDFVKFDLSLIRGIHRAAPDRRHMVSSLVSMVETLGIGALAEGVETEAEHAECCQLGFTMGQGRFYGRPASIKAILRGSGT